MHATQLRLTSTASRFLRVLFSAIICLVAALMVSSLLWHSGGGHYTHRIGGALFLIVFLGMPLTAFISVIVPILFWLDRQAPRDFWLNYKRSAGLVLVLAIGVLTGFFSPLLGAFFVFLLFYWVLTGRVAGREGWSIGNFARTRWDEQLYLIVTIIFFTTLVVTSSASFLDSVANKALPFEPGEPPFQVEYEHQVTGDVRRALQRFPNAQACLERGANAERREDLLRLDWDIIITTGDAEVCAFRLIYEWGGVAEATTWLEHQGFEVGEHFSSSLPYVSHDGTLRVDGSWSIRNNGPRFPTSGMARRIMRSVAYGMGVRTTFSADGEELLYVHINFSTL